MKEYCSGWASTCPQISQISQITQIKWIHRFVFVRVVRGSYFARAWILPGSLGHFYNQLSPKSEVWTFAALEILGSGL